ncbi:MAG: hypothetical protein FWH18_03000 [Marinilabiliaceae bacterium]|nr:hypothetical protein [Marinilabiliaceae bacterium]
MKKVSLLIYLFVFVAPFAELRAEYEIENGDIETFTTLFSEDVNYTLQLWSDHYGLVKSVSSIQAIVQIPVNDLSSGIYYLHFIIDGQILDKQKVIKN